MKDRPSNEERLDWRIGALVTIVGVGMIILGLYLADFDRDAWSGMSIEVGAAIALVAILFVLERRLVARTVKTAETAARAAVSDATGAIKDRLDRLEEVDEAQARRREERRRQAESTSEAVRTQVLDAARVGDLLGGAAKSNLFDIESGVRLRTSAEPDCPILYLFCANLGQGQSLIVLDFEPIRFSGEHVEGMPVPDSTETSVLWTEESAGEIAGRLDESLERVNIAPDKFRFQYALDRLVRSVDIMRGARGATSDSPLRLEGRLRLLINDEWVLTDWGLESAVTSRRFKREWVTRKDRNWGVEGFVISESEQVDADTPLREALRWIEEREGLVLSEARFSSASRHW